MAFSTTNRGYIRAVFSINSHGLDVTIQDSGRGLSLKDKYSFMRSSIELNRVKGNVSINNLIENLGAVVTIDSALDLGTKVTFKIPAEVKVVTALGLVSGGKSKKSDDKEQNATFVSNICDRGVKVLAVPGCYEFSIVMDQLLSPEGLRRNDVEVTFCLDPSEALREVESNEYDLIVIDESLQTVDGFLIFKFVNNIETNKPKTTILLDHQDSISKASELADNYFMKCKVKSSDFKGVIRNASMKPVNYQRHNEI